MTAALCDACQTAAFGYNTTHFRSINGQYRNLCSQCLNEEVARLNGRDFEHVSFEPIDVTDATGRRRRFEFNLRLLGDRVALDAFEVINGESGGYTFQIVDSDDVDLFVLIGRLVDSIRRGVAVRYLNDGDFGLQIADKTVDAQIGYDPDSEGRTPLLVIDGREVTGFS